ncbi:hypothetical protein GCM10025868_09260 [Angustibacter aerolatus]|uniref:Uncharacterized protein n=1 Tax=Angustibacter aerolatus TaxID=1162965 RepID=A0ABQ6JBX0_9ACTN|nr:hypothetical protein GCM10025868_09260 [Angustibacter aerolatus]
MRGCVANARLAGFTAGHLSSTTTDRPIRARSPATVAPVGPAPTTTTSTSWTSRGRGTESVAGGRDEGADTGDS